MRKKIPPNSMRKMIFRSNLFIFLAAIAILICGLYSCAPTNALPEPAEPTNTLRTEHIESSPTITSVESPSIGIIPGKVKPVEMNTEESTQTPPRNETMKIIVQGNGISVVFVLNNSRAAVGLYDQLPLTIQVENYSTNEKIFYPPQTLNTADAPLAYAKAGTLAYYAPWGDVVMFYKDFDSAAGLYELGSAISGAEFIGEISGSIVITKVD